jgi:hypothetical protein
MEAAQLISLEALDALTHCTSSNKQQHHNCGSTRASAVGGAVFMNSNTTSTTAGCIFNGNDGTTGHNDIPRRDDTSNVTFACSLELPVLKEAGAA